MTERLAVIGDPIEHSLSPLMHMAALRAAGIDATYEARRVASADLVETVRDLRTRQYRGFNVTIPHKSAILPSLDSVDASAQRIGAVNTVVAGNGHLCGHNTDPTGFREALRRLSHGTLPKRAVLFGAGGAARAVLSVLAEYGCRCAVVARNSHAAMAVAELAGVLGTVIGVEDGKLCTALQEADLVVNATPLGMVHLPHGNPIPEGCRLQSTTLVMDLIYGRETPLLRQARAVGCTAGDGLDMLVQQGAAAFVLWFGIEPDTGAMEAACRNRLLEMSSC